MRWEAVVLIGLIVASVLFIIGMIGKPREPYTPSGAVFTVIIAALQCWLLYRLGAS